MQNAPQKIDYSRGPLWWFTVHLYAKYFSRPTHITAVRAADFEEAKRKARALSVDVWKRDDADVWVRPMMERHGGLRVHAFAGYGDE